MYEINVSLVNGDIIQDILDICNEQFLDPFEQQFAGANAECMYCGATQKKDGSADHYNCPVIKYQKIAEKHKRFIVKK